MTHQNAQLSIKALNTLPPVLTPPDSTGKSVWSWVGAGEEDPGVDGARNERVDEPSVDIVQGTSTRSTFERLQATDGRMLKSNSIGLSNGAPRCFAADDAVAVARGPENPRNGTPYPTTVSFLLFFPRSFLSYLSNGALGCDSMISAFTTPSRTRRSRPGTRHATPLPRRTPDNSRLGTTTNRPYSL